MACFTYEGVLLFGVLMIAGYLFSSLTQQRHALVGRHGLQAFLFVVLGIYFTWFWSRGGQTVAMKAWNIRVVQQDGEAVTQPRAFARYLLSWLWFLPSLAALYLSGLNGAGATFGCWPPAWRPTPRCRFFIPIGSSGMTPSAAPGSSPALLDHAAEIIVRAQSAPI